jgi:hypothetical protein
MLEVVTTLHILHCTFSASPIAETWQSTKTVRRDSDFQVLGAFLQHDYCGPGTLLVHPFLDMKGEIKEKGAPRRAPGRARRHRLGREERRQRLEDVDRRVLAPPASPVTLPPVVAAAAVVLPVALVFQFRPESRS